MNKNELIEKLSFRILWVDDNAFISETSSILVESLGHKCKTVMSGKKALEYLNENSCDIVITDIGMPEMNGWELAKAIRSKFENKIKIIAVTGWDIETQVKEGNDIDIFLQKPFTLKELKNILINI